MEIKNNIKNAIEKFKKGAKDIKDEISGRISDIGKSALEKKRNRIIRAHSRNGLDWGASRWLRQRAQNNTDNYKFGYTKQDVKDFNESKNNLKKIEAELRKKGQLNDPKYYLDPRHKVMAKHLENTQGAKFIGHTGVPNNISSKSPFPNMTNEADVWAMDNIKYPILAANYDQDEDRPYEKEGKIHSLVVNKKIYDSPENQPDYKDSGYIYNWAAVPKDDKSQSEVGNWMKASFDDNPRSRVPSIDATDNNFETTDNKVKRKHNNAFTNMPGVFEGLKDCYGNDFVINNKGKDRSQRANYKIIAGHTGKINWDSEDRFRYFSK